MGKALKIGKVRRFLGFLPTLVAFSPVLRGRRRRSDKVGARSRPGLDPVSISRSKVAVIPRVRLGVVGVFGVGRAKNDLSLVLSALMAYALFHLTFSTSQILNLYWVCFGSVTKPVRTLPRRVDRSSVPHLGRRSRKPRHSENPVFSFTNPVTVTDARTSPKPVTGVPDGRPSLQNVHSFWFTDLFWPISPERGGRSPTPEGNRGIFGFVDDRVGQGFRGVFSRVRG